MNAQAMRPNEWPQNERTKAANERTDNIMYERTNKPNNRMSEMSAKKKGEWTNGTNKRPQTRRPNKWLKYTYFFFFFFFILYPSVWPFVSPPPTSSFEVLKGPKLKRSLEFLGSDS